MIDITDEGPQGLSGLWNFGGEGGRVTVPSICAALDRNGGEPGQSAAGSA